MLATLKAFLLSLSGLVKLKNNATLIQAGKDKEYIKSLEAELEIYKAANKALQNKVDYLKEAVWATTVDDAIKQL